MKSIPEIAKIATKEAFEKAKRYGALILEEGRLMRVYETHKILDKSFFTDLGYKIDKYSTEGVPTGESWGFLTKETADYVGFYCNSDGTYKIWLNNLTLDQFEHILKELENK